MLRDSPMFPRNSFPRNHPPLTARLSDISFPFRQTPDCSDIITFWSLLTKICVFIDIMAFSTGEGGWKLAALPRPVSPAPAPSPVPYPGYCTRLTCPLLPTDNLNNRKPIQKPRSMPAPTVTLSVPTPSRPVPRLSTGRSFPSY